MKARVWTRALLAGLGLVLSLALASTAFVSWRFGPHGLMPVPRFSASLLWQRAPAQLRWLLPFMVLSAAVIPLRALQWQRTLSCPVPFRERYHLVAIGAFTHYAFPGKLGDVMRAFLLSRTQGLPFFQSLGSVLVCKLLELCVLSALVVASLLGPFRAIAPQFRGVLHVVAPICVSLVVLVIVLAHHAQSLAAWLDRSGRFPRSRIFLHEVGDGLGTAKSLRGMLRALAYSALPVLASATAYGIALQFLGVPTGFLAGPLVIGAIALGQSAVGLPADVGLYYFLTSGIARRLGASPEEAAAFAILTHVGTLLSQISVGAVSVWVRKLRWADLRLRSRLAAEAARHPEDFEPVGV